MGIAPILFKGDQERIPTPDTGEPPDDSSSDARIRCPRCAWEPTRHDRWMCSCLHVWNTFDTRGRCPACGKQWTETQCLRCQAWSAHLDWYVDEAGPLP